MPKKKENKDISAALKEVTLAILEKVQITAEVLVTQKESGEEKEQGKYYQVDISTPDSGLLIGYHGETLNSLQLILGVIIYNKVGEWQRIVVDIGDYRKAREQSIKEMVERIAEEVVQSGTPVTLPLTTSYERRIVHLMLTDNVKVTSESSGEGKERRLTIKLRE